MGSSEQEGNGRKAVTFKIREDLLVEFSRLCEEKGLIMSRRIEKCIEADIEKIKAMDH
ncbi:hypothetical protein HYX10_05245 [Candidatus Woesearchaeota archaeon]|nr:hypothetical protein [Candidatus Woesearchaeota archaeon]